MSVLTAKQEAFAQAVASGMTQADAYRRAYDAANMKPATIQNSAYKVMLYDDVSARVAELRNALASKALWTREKSVQALANIADDTEGRASDKTAAIKELNAMHGFNAPTKLEVDGNIGLSVNVNFD